MELIKSWWRCFWSIWLHKWYFFLAARQVGGIGWYRILKHDLSNLLPDEFFLYARGMHRKPGDLTAIHLARMRHHSRNDHHPEYWANKELPVILMPGICTREMVADWMAAEMTYHNNPGLTEWIRGDYRARIRPLLHEETNVLILRILGDLGYTLDNNGYFPFEAKYDRN